MIGGDCSRGGGGGLLNVGVLGGTAAGVGVGEDSGLGAGLFEATLPAIPNQWLDSEACNGHHRAKVIDATEYSIICTVVMWSRLSGRQVHMFSTVQTCRMSFLTSSYTTLLQ